MKISRRGLNHIKREEGCKLQMYRCAANLPTIGIGHLITEEEWQSGSININGESILWRGGITLDQALNLLDQDADYAEAAVNDYVEVPLTQPQFDVLVSFIFNVGIGRPASEGRKGTGFRGSSLLKQLNQGNYEAVPGELLKWVRANGRVARGLVYRRRREALLWKEKYYAVETLNQLPANLTATPDSVPDIPDPSPDLDKKGDGGRRETESVEDLPPGCDLWPDPFDGLPGSEETVPLPVGRDPDPGPGGASGGSLWTELIRLGTKLLGR